MVKPSGFLPGRLRMFCAKVAGNTTKWFGGLFGGHHTSEPQLRTLHPEPQNPKALNSKPRIGASHVPQANPWILTSPLGHCVASP